MAKTPASLWLRMGDGSEYEAHGDDLASAASAVACYDIGPLDSIEWIRGGFRSDNFPGHNYVSLYYGDRHSNYSHDLDDAEKAEFEELLAEELGDVSEKV